MSEAVEISVPGPVSAVQISVPSAVGAVSVATLETAGLASRLSALEAFRALIGALTPEDFGAVGDGDSATPTDNFNAFPRLFNRWRCTITVIGGGVAEVTTDGVHDFVAGEQIKIFGSVNGPFEGLKTVSSVPSPTRFRFAYAGTAANDGNAMLRCERVLTTRRNIFIPPGKTYATSKTVYLGRNAYVFQGGDFLALGENMGQLLMVERVNNLVVDCAGVADGNFKRNINGWAFGVDTGNPNLVAETEFCRDVIINNPRSRHCRTAEGTSPTGGGGKGATGQFKVGHVIVNNFVSEDDDIGVAIESALGREMPGCIFNSPTIVGWRKTAIYAAGHNPDGYSSDAPAGAGYLEAPGAAIRSPRIQQGNPQPVAIPGVGTVQQWEAFGVISLNNAVGCAITDIECEETQRVTLVRGGPQGCKITGRFFTDAIETAFDGRELSWLPKSTVDANNNVDIEVHNKDTAASYGYIARGQNGRFRNGSLRVAFRGFTGAGIVAANTFGPGVDYDITDLGTPTRRVVGTSDHVAVPVLPTTGTLYLSPTAIRNAAGNDVLAIGAGPAEGVVFAGAAWNDRYLRIGGRALWMSATGLREAGTPAADNSGAGIAYWLTVTQANGAATIDVRRASAVVLASASPVSVTNFTSGSDGQILAALFVSSNVTLVHNPAAMRLRGGVNVTPADGDVILFVRSSNIWREISRTF